MKRNKGIKWSVAIGAGLLMMLALPAMAWACSEGPYRQYEMATINSDEPSEEAVFPDDPVSLELSSISRAGAFRANTTACETNDGTISVHVNGYDEGHGLMFETEGSHPRDGVIGVGAAVDLTDRNGNYTIRWNDYETRGESIDITITAQWVDEYGRKGPKSDPLHIVDAGKGLTSGCASTHVGGSTPIALMIGLFGLIALRRSASLGDGVQNS